MRQRSRRRLGKEISPEFGGLFLWKSCLMCRKVEKKLLEVSQARLTKLLFRSLKKA